MLHCVNVLGSNIMKWHNCEIWLGDTINVYSLNSYSFRIVEGNLEGEKRMIDTLLVILLFTLCSLIKTGSSAIYCSHCRLNLLKNKTQKKTTSYTLNKGYFLKLPYLLVLIWSHFRKLQWKLVIGIRLTNSSSKLMLFCSFEIWLIDTR